MRRILLLGSIVTATFLLVIGDSWTAPARPEKAVPNELPCAWSLEEIAKEAPGDGRLFVLAWKIVEDARPVRAESCLVLRVIGKNEGYCLSHLYRDPAAKKPEWEIMMTHVLDNFHSAGRWVMHCTDFKKKPSNKEIYAALSREDVEWTFAQEEGWRFVACGVCEKSWQEAIGEKPTRFFGR